MSPTISQMRIRSENKENTIQNPCAKNRAGSTSMCETKRVGNQLECRLDDTIMLYFENVNGLLISKCGFHSEKVSSLRHIWSKLNVDIIPLVDT